MFVTFRLLIRLFMTFHDFNFLLFQRCEFSLKAIYFFVNHAQFMLDLLFFCTFGSV